MTALPPDARRFLSALAALPAGTSVPVRDLRIFASQAAYRNARSFCRKNALAAFDRDSQGWYITTKGRAELLAEQHSERQTQG